jgi:hypothetical protein
MQPRALTAASAAPTPDARRRSVRRTAIVFALIAAGFYFGFIVMTLVRGSR